MASPMKKCVRCEKPRASRAVTGMCRSCHLPPRPPKPCKGGCGVMLPGWDKTYCSAACRPERPRKPCSHCGGPRAKGSTRNTCSDECARARVLQNSTWGQRSESKRAKRRAQERVKYRRPDKAEVIARLTHEQAGLCAVCKEAHPLILDHCHRTGNPRAMLCRRCNAALGLMHEDPDKILALHKYAVKLKGIYPPLT